MNIKIITTLTLMLMLSCSLNSTDISKKPDSTTVSQKEKRNILFRSDYVSDEELGFKTITLDEAMLGELPVENKIKITMPEDYVGVINPEEDLFTVWGNYDKFMSEDLSTFNGGSVLGIRINKEFFTDDKSFVKLVDNKVISLDLMEYFVEKEYSNIIVNEYEDRYPVIGVTALNDCMQLERRLFLGFSGMPYVLELFYFYFGSDESEEELIWEKIVESTRSSNRRKHDDNELLENINKLKNEQDREELLCKALSSSAQVFAKYNQEKGKNKLTANNEENSDEEFQNQKEFSNKYGYETNFRFKTMSLHSALFRGFKIASNIDLTIPDDYTGTKNTKDEWFSVWGNYDKHMSKNKKKILGGSVLSVKIRRDLFTDDHTLLKLKGETLVEFDYMKHYKKEGYKKVELKEYKENYPILEMSGLNQNKDKVNQLLIGLGGLPLVLELSFQNFGEDKIEEEFIWNKLVDSAIAGYNSRTWQYCNMEDYNDIEDDEKRLQKIFSFVKEYVDFPETSKKKTKKNAKKKPIAKDKFDLKHPATDIDMEFKTISLDEAFKGSLTFPSSIEIKMPENYIGLNNPYQNLYTVWGKNKDIVKYEKGDSENLPEGGLLKIRINLGLFYKDGELIHLSGEPISDEELRETGNKEVVKYDTGCSHPFVVMKGVSEANKPFYMLYAGMSMESMVLTVSFFNLNPDESDELIWYNIVESIFKSINGSKITLDEKEKRATMADYLDMENEAESYQPKADEFIELAKSRDLDAIIGILAPVLKAQVGEDILSNYFTESMFPFFEDIEKFEDYHEVMNEVDTEGNLGYSFIYKAKLKNGEVSEIKVGVAKLDDQYYVIGFLM